MSVPHVQNMGIRNWTCPYHRWLSTENPLLFQRITIYIVFSAFAAYHAHGLPSRCSQCSSSDISQCLTPVIAPTHYKWAATRFVDKIITPYTSLNCWRVWSINVNCWSWPRPMLSIVWKFAIPWPSDWRLPSSSNINLVLYNGFWLRSFHLFATQALCQFTARPLQPVTRLYVNLNYQAIYFSRTAYTSAANGDTIPQSVDVYHTDCNTTFR